MSVSGIFSSNFSDYGFQGVQNKRQEIQQEFQQLGEDLESGNLSAAQSDFATLQQMVPQNNSTSAQSNNPIEQAFNQLAQDLQSGNLSAAQQDYTTIQQDFQNRATQAGSSFYNNGAESVQNQQQEIQQEFQQLGQDLESGNLSAAQSDFATLQQMVPQNNSSSTQSNNPIAQAFQQLGQDLQSGNLSAAQQEYTTIQQGFQNQASQAGSSFSQSEMMHGHHHHHGGGGEESELSQLFDQLGQALQSGDLSTAQQVFSTLQQDFQQFGQANGLSSSQASSGQSSSSVSLSA